jgi:hypothetical protein
MGWAMIDHSEPVQTAEISDDGTQPSSGSQLARLYADLQLVILCDQFGKSAASPELDAVLERLAAQAPVIKRLASGLDEHALQSALAAKLADGPVADRLRERSQADGSLTAMLQRRAERFEEVIARRRNAGAAVTFSDDPITSDDLCVLAVAAVVVGSAGGPITAYHAYQIC